MAGKFRIDPVPCDKRNEKIDKATACFLGNIQNFIDDGFRRSDIARGACLNPSGTVTNWFKRGEMPIARTLVLMCYSLHITPNELLGIEEEDVK